jgi:hypothetical protein
MQELLDAEIELANDCKNGDCERIGDLVIWML